ncbi:MAG: hypothetical protein M0P13_04850 [Fibrobacteraceae bacterium]|nr:hypothetical protein [Fibrobacteraceae bacterium]
MQDAVLPEAHDELALARLEMDVGNPAVHRLRNDFIHKTHRRSLQALIRPRGRGLRGIPVDKGIYPFIDPRRLRTHGNHRNAYGGLDVRDQFKVIRIRHGEGKRARRRI